MAVRFIGSFHRLAPETGNAQLSTVVIEKNSPLHSIQCFQAFVHGKKVQCMCIPSSHDPLSPSPFVCYL